MVVAAALLAAGVYAAPARAADEPPDSPLPIPDCPSFQGDPSAQDEFEAYRIALACETNVEVLGLRDVDRQVYATPAGTLDAQIAVEPYQVPTADGGWVPIDPTLVARPDGTAAAAATVIRIETGPGGDRPFVTATDPDGGSLSLRWPHGPLPAPVLNGPVATFPGVLPDVDLAVQAESVGFSWVLVVRSAEAAANPVLSSIRVGIETVGLTTVEDPGSGTIGVVDDSGAVVFEAGQAIMWDSSVPGDPAARTAAAPPADPGRIGHVDVDLTDTGVVLGPDAAMLADPDVTFPLYIDPPFTSTRKAWANVFSGAASRGWTGDSSWPRSGGMRVGLDTWSNCGSGCGLWRSVITLDVGKLRGRYIASASVHMLQTHLGGCGDRYLQLWRTKEITNSVSWNGVSWLYGEPLQSKLVPSSNQTGCSGKTNEWVEFDGAEVRKRVQSAADQNYAAISFGVRSANEDTRDAWRRIRIDSVKLHVTYYIYPPSPDRLTVDGTSCVRNISGSPWITSRYPTLSARARSTESESVYLRMRIRKYGSDTNHYWYRTPDPVGGNPTVNRRITTSLPDGRYEWQARSDSRQTDAVNSGYTDLCYFRVDATKPSVPTVTAPAGPFTEGRDVVLSVSASDPEVNGFHSGLDRYEYSWNTPVFDQKVTTSGTATVTRTAATAGRHVLYVRSVDTAGNVSDERAYTFFVGRDIPATEMGMWRFEGDTFDDTRHGRDLTRTAGTGPVYGPDRAGRTAGALVLDGTTCLSSPEVPIRTDAAFTVALWVRLDAASGYTKVLTQGNEQHSAYQIQYDAALNKWNFSLLSAPGTDFSWKSVGAVSPAAPGTWLHVAGTYDPDAGVQRLYLDGALAAEQAVSFTPWNAAKTFSLGCLRNPSGSHGHFLTGAVDSVAVWQGLATTAQIQAAMTDLPAAAELVRWEFRDGGTDSSRYGRPLALGEDVVVGEDPFHRPSGAVELDGATCLESSGPILATERSYSVSSWVRIDSVDELGAIVSTFAAEDHAGLELSVRPTTKSGYDYEFEDDFRAPTGVSAAGGMSAAAVVTALGYGRFGQWHHIALAVDVTTDRLTFYLDGSLAKSVLGPPAWTVIDNPVLLGCSYGWNSAGVDPRAYHLDGALHDVRLWRGVVSAADVTSMFGGPPAELQARWRLEGAGTDTSGRGHALTLEGDTRYDDGWWCDPDGALELGGAGSAVTAGPVIATDESFTVSAWVRLNTVTAHAQVVTAAGQQTSAFRLQYNADRQLFGFAMTSGDVASPTWKVAYGGPTPTVGTWYHLAGVYDLRAKQTRFYVSGALVATGTGPDSPWRATGPLLVGAASTTPGTRISRLDGAIDDVVVWQGAIPEYVLSHIADAPVPQC
ncbi:LamG-like jellyroll fold domain-containing protein [Plantactinospora sp. B5E13]|uniref:LamG-like jellyroll fold domain-containing protein n=1 Tax=unclassified Plantactinospora TaxID=2631981 RepID=UPI00325F50BB